MRVPPRSAGATAMTDWSLELARKTYSIPHWADGYYDVDAQGRIVAVRCG